MKRLARLAIALPIFILIGLYWYLSDLMDLLIPALERQVALCKKLEKEKKAACDRPLEIFKKQKYTMRKMSILQAMIWATKSSMNTIYGLIKILSRRL